ncbi:MAG: hypothetical protein FWD42_04450 [Solirubrobacterales bacterium]|nr:hypothetical protein [Solirubrobacterales bacterium]
MIEARTRALATALLCALAAALAGCGGGGGSDGGGAPGPGPGPGAGEAARARALASNGPCAGAASCPYRRVMTIGRRGVGVLRYPEAIAVGPGGRVYVGDQDSHLVQIFSASGRFEGQWGSDGSGPGQFGAVGGLAVDGRGDVYLVDSTHDRVERFGPGGRLLSMWGEHGRGVGQFAFGPGYGPDKPPGGGIAVEGDHVYVADTDNNRVQRFSLDGSHPMVWVGAGRGPGGVMYPRGMTAAGGTVWVADDGNGRVDAFDSAGREVAQSGSVGRYFGGRFENVFDVAVHGERVYAVDDNHGRIVVLNRALRYLSSWSGEGSWQMSKYVRAVATDAAGRVYVGDTSHGRVEVFTGEGTPLRQWGVSGTAPGQLVEPLDVAYRPGHVMVVETLGSHSALLQFDARLAYRQAWEKGGEAILGDHWFAPTAAAFAPDGTVWVTDLNNGLVRHLGLFGSFLGALGVAGLSAPQGGGHQATRLGTFAKPSGVAVDSGGDVYVADTGNDRVQKLSRGGRVLGVWGQGDPGGGATGGGDPSLSAPSAVALGPGGRVYVVDAGHRRVVELGANGGVRAAFGGAGGARGRFLAPAGIAVDSEGDVFVSDSQADRIQEFDPGGRLLEAWGAPGGALGQLSDPTGMAVDCAGDLLVADTGNNRVQVFTGVAAPAIGCPAR